MQIHYAIHCTPNFHATDLFRRHRPFYLSNETGKRLILATKQDAETLCDMLNNHDYGYVCEHNQYAAPDYVPTEISGDNATPVNLRTAMVILDLQYDFNADGSRKSLEEIYT